MEGTVQRQNDTGLFEANVAGAAGVGGGVAATGQGGVWLGGVPVAGGGGSVPAGQGGASRALKEMLGLL